MNKGILIRVKPGKLKIGASFTSQVVTLALPAVKIIEQINRVTKEVPYPLRKTLVELTMDQGVLKVRNLYPGDSQMVKALGKDRQDLLSLLNQVREKYGLKPINERTLGGITKTIK